MEPTEIYALIDTKNGELTQLLARDDANDDDLARAEALAEEIKGLKADAKKAEDRQVKVAALRQQAADTAREMETPQLPAGFAFAKGAAPGSPATRHGVHVGRTIEAVEAEADKTKSLADNLRCITVAMCPQLAAQQFGGFEGQRKAIERLEKVYGSRLRAWESKTLTESSGIAGGYTVAPQYNTQLLQIMAEMSIVRPYANVKTLPAREAYFPMLNQTATSAPSNGSNYYAGAYVSWTNEAAAESSTLEPNFKQLHVVTNELTALAQVSRTLMSDSFLAMESELRQIFAGAVAHEEDKQFISGDGQGKPKGVTGSGAYVTVTRATSSKFKLADAASMMGRLLSESRPRSVWVMNNDVFPELVQLVDASGRVTYISNVGTGFDRADLSGRLLLFGRPVIFTEKLPALGTANDAILCDFSKYIVADTGTLEIAVSDQYAFNKNVLTFRVVKRVDGRAQMDAPYKPLAGSTLSPFVGLAA